MGPLLKSSSSIAFCSISVFIAPRAVKNANAAPPVNIIPAYSGKLSPVIYGVCVERETKREQSEREREEGKEGRTKESGKNSKKQGEV